MIVYSLDTMFRKWDEEMGPCNAAKQVILLSSEEFETAVHNVPHKKALLLALRQIVYCKAELYGSCILGTLSIPVKHGKIDGALQLGFYLLEHRLYLIGEEEQLVHLVGRMRENQFPKDLSVFGFFCSLLNCWIDNDFDFIQSCENQLSEMESKLLEQIPKQFYAWLLPYRRDLMTLHGYYYQLMNLASTICANTNHMLPPEDCLSFEHFASRVDILRNHVEMLREYTMQIREMYLAQINYSQSKSMNLLTVISAIFLPLTLLAGWYGMNFSHMPELSSPFGYPAIILLAVVIVIVEIVIFHKKNLL